MNFEVSGAAAKRTRTGLGAEVPELRYRPETATLTKRQVDTVRHEVPWASESQAKRLAYRAQDTADAALVMLCSEPGRELTESDKANFLVWTADTQLMMAITQVKEWGLDIEPVDLSILNSASSQETWREESISMMLRAGFILWSLGTLRKDGEEKMQQLGGEDWRQAVREEIKVNETFLRELRAFLSAGGLSERQVTNFILSGFDCRLGNILLACEAFDGSKKES